MNTTGHRRCCVYDTHITTYNTFSKHHQFNVSNIRRYGDESLGRYFQTLQWDGLPASSGSNGTAVGLLLGPEDVGKKHFRNIGKYLPVQRVPDVFNRQQ